MWLKQENNWGGVVTHGGLKPDLNLEEAKSDFWKPQSTCSISSLIHNKGWRCLFKHALFCYKDHGCKLCVGVQRDNLAPCKKQLDRDVNSENRKCDVNVKSQLKDLLHKCAGSCRTFSDQHLFTFALWKVNRHFLVTYNQTTDFISSALW